MKKFILSVVLSFISFVSVSQIVEVTFNEHLSFTNPINSDDYFTIISQDSITLDKKRLGNNKYVINLDKKIVSLFFQGSFIKKTTINKVDYKDGFIILTINDIDMISGQPMFVYLVINQHSDKNDYPYFTFYFESDGITNGYLVLEKTI